MASSRTRRAQAHARHTFYCTCGKIVHGNGGKANHGSMHTRRDDGHRFVAQSTFSQLWPASGDPV